MSILAEKIGEAMKTEGKDNVWKKVKEISKHQPETTTSFEAGQRLQGKKKVLIITGAGISAASNIPTFRGSSDSIWKQKYKYCSSPE